MRATTNWLAAAAELGIREIRLLSTFEGTGLIGSIIRASAISSRLYKPGANGNMEHAKTSPIPKINSALRRITFGIVATVAAYKFYVYKTRLQDQPHKQKPPGSFTGENVEPAVRKSKYQGAGHSYLGRKGGDRFT